MQKERHRPMVLSSFETSKMEAQIIFILLFQFYSLTKQVIISFYQGWVNFEELSQMRTTEITLLAGLNVIKLFL